MGGIVNTATGIGRPFHLDAEVTLTFAFSIVFSLPVALIKDTKKIKDWSGGALGRTSLNLERGFLKEKGLLRQFNFFLNLY